MLTPLLDIKDVCFRPPHHERNVLCDVSLNLYAGDFLVVLGSNGSGKSSLLKCINGLNTVCSGAIHLGGNPIHNLGVERIAREVATLPQHAEASTFGSLTVRENLELAGVGCGKRYLEEVFPPLIEKLATPTNKLSGGQRQALALAMCTVGTPRLLILDEHTSALDPKTALYVMEVTKNMSQRHSKMAVIMATHSLDTALAYGNRLVVMQKGRPVYHCDKRVEEAPSKAGLLDLYG